LRIDRLGSVSDRSATETGVGFVAFYVSSVTILLGLFLVSLVGVIALFQSRNDDYSCITGRDTPASVASPEGPVSGDFGTFPIGLSCTYVLEDGSLLTEGPGWGLTAVGGAGVALLAAGSTLPLVTPSRRPIGEVSRGAPAEPA